MIPETLRQYHFVSGLAPLPVHTAHLCLSVYPLLTQSHNRMLGLREAKWSGRRYDPCGDTMWTSTSPPGTRN